ncbi:MAG: methylenetetrahydrofolate reductase [Nitrospirae bacterium]|nr:methylenetetrahydrofolate reductase [Nitrospirota bacterium]
MLPFQEALKSGEFVVTAEFAPPKGADLSVLRQRVEMVRGHVHAVNLTDCQLAVMRMSSWAAALEVLRGGVEPICQLTCRDRNRIALQADLLGLWAHGIKTVLALTGDGVVFGDQKEAKGVFEMNSIRLLKTIETLNSGKDLSGHELRGATGFFAGAALNISVGNIEPHIKKLERKLAAGAKFIQTQPIFSLAQYESFRRQAAYLNHAAILPGILYLKSAEGARRAAQMVPGVELPQDTIDRLEKSPNPRKEGVKLAAELFRAFKKDSPGVHLMTLSSAKAALQILEKAG